MAQIKSGFASVTNGSATVIGDEDCDWSDVESGHIFSLQGSDNWYYVQSAQFVVDHWELTLAGQYEGDTAADQAYAITTSFSPGFNIPYPERGDVETASIVKRAILQIDSELGTLEARDPGGIVILLDEDPQKATFIFGPEITVEEIAGTYPTVRITFPD